MAGPGGAVEITTETDAALFFDLRIWHARHVLLAEQAQGCLVRLHQPGQFEGHPNQARTGVELVLTCVTQPARRPSDDALPIRQCRLALPRSTAARAGVRYVSIRRG
jgi:hypothetical protein